jgi:hypothetical protein
MTAAKTPQQVRDEATAKRLGIRLAPKPMHYYSRATPIFNPAAGAAQQERK